MFEQPGQIGMFAIGFLLGWLVMYLVRHKVGVASVLAVILGTGFVSYLYTVGLLDYYGVGVLLGFLINALLRGIGQLIGGRVARITRGLSVRD